MMILNDKLKKGQGGNDMAYFKAQPPELEQ
jgi:hypothetical protein